MGGWKGEVRTTPSISEVPFCLPCLEGESFGGGLLEGDGVRLLDVWRLRGVGVGAREVDTAFDSRDQTRMGTILFEARGPWGGEDLCQQ